MAIVLAVIPPGNYGGDPGHTRKINNFHWHSLLRVVEILISCNSKSAEVEATSSVLDGLSSEILRKSATMRELTFDFEKDASRLHQLSCFRVDPRLKVELGKVTRDIYVARFIPHLAAKIMGSESSRSVLLDKNGPVQRRLEGIRSNMVNDGIAATAQESKEDFHLPSSELPDTRDDIDLLLKSIQWLVTEMRSRDAALKAIGVNRCGIYQNFSVAST